MKTEKIHQSTEAFTENANIYMKWFQDYSALMLEVQSKQVKFATELFNNAFTSSFTSFGQGGNFGANFGGSEKITEMVQKNMETVSKMSQENMKTLMALNIEATSKLFSKEALQKAADAYAKQVEEITAFNKSSLEAFTKQIELTNSYAKPLTENLKHQFEANFQQLNTTMKEFMGSLSSFTQPSFGTSTNIFSTLTEQMGTAFSNNMKLWSDLMNKTQHAETSFIAEPVYNETKKAEHKEHHVSKSKLQPVHA
ncbi:MAG: hypothetical protein Q8M29_04455 [Bacteroidota bacterium]|nr:hypothetical protein [Bacteroidota bacterium]